MKSQKVDIINKKSQKNAEAVFEAIHTLMHLIRSEQYRVLRDSPYQLTHMEGKMLAYFSQNPGATLRELVIHTGRDKGQLARTIKTLKEQGLLIGEEDPNDRRSQLLSLTTEGTKINESLIDQLNHLTELAVHDLSDADCQKLLQLLTQIRANIQRSNDKKDSK
ncbi:MarR family winged helix-turn-helix transcriptional regulator [Cerasicoccus arenae]|nr:MarR family transcriptional regulator [Cerasicoccus arenae]MBK1858521.1 MarR family transcriptional regulator [Cerasicoccus arenae]